MKAWPSRRVYVQRGLVGGGLKRVGTHPEGASGLGAVLEEVWVEMVALVQGYESSSEGGCCMEEFYLSKVEQWWEWTVRGEKEEKGGGRKRSYLPLGCMNPSRRRSSKKG